MTAMSRKAGDGGFSGSGAATGNSRGFRFEKAFFRAAPEFETARAVRISPIGPGTALIRVVDPQPASEEADPAIAAWLSFLEADMRDSPQHLTGLAERELTALEKLVDGVVVRDDDVLPEDVTF